MAVAKTAVHRGAPKHLFDVKRVVDFDPHPQALSRVFLTAKRAVQIPSFGGVEAEAQSALRRESGRAEPRQKDQHGRPGWLLNAEHGPIGVTSTALPWSTKVNADCARV